MSRRGPLTKEDVADPQQPCPCCTGSAPALLPSTHDPDFHGSHSRALRMVLSPSGWVLPNFCQASGPFRSLNLQGLPLALSCPSWASRAAKAPAWLSAPSWCSPACPLVPCLQRGGGLIGDWDGQSLSLCQDPRKHGRLSFFRMSAASDF